MQKMQMSAFKQCQNKYILTLIAILFSIAATFSNASTSTADKPNRADATQEIPSQDTNIEQNQSTEPSDAETQGKVARAVFTSQIIDREPADSLMEMSNASDRIYFFTDLRDMEGQIISHRWEYNSEVKAEVKFKVGGGPRWRVYSSKNLLPEWTGVWTVFVIDENENILNKSEFNYTQSDSVTDSESTTGATTAN